MATVLEWFDHFFHISAMLHRVKWLEGIVLFVMVVIASHVLKALYLRLYPND